MGRGLTYWGTVLVLLLVATTASEARYFGGWGGGSSTTVVVRHRQGGGGFRGGGGGRWRGRRSLLLEIHHEVATDSTNESGDAITPKEQKLVPKKCQTILKIIESRPELSKLAKAVEDLPLIRAAMDNKTRDDAFFAPTNDAIDSLLAWGGFLERAKVGYTKVTRLPPLFTLFFCCESEPVR
jgi:hypothetical protein